MINFIEICMERYGAIQVSDKNVTMNCPKCGKDDKHFMISTNKNYPVCHCFKCGFKTSWAGLYSTLAKVPYGEAKSILEDSVWVQEKKKKEEIQSIPFPVKARWTDEAWDYLQSRGIDREIIDKFGIYYCATGRFGGRIILPIVFKGKSITFQARAVGNHRIRYLSPLNSPTGRILFNYDEIKEESVVLVEGFFDTVAVWKAGYSAVGSLGKHLSEDQILALREKGVREIILMYDSDAMDTMKKMFMSLQGYFDKVSIAPLAEGDPADCRDFSIPLSNLLSSTREINNYLMKRFRTTRKLDNAVNMW